jgi:hypothetical protein
MPEISRFFGIAIRMHWKEHSPPHFHALYAGDEVEIAISPLGILDGRLPPRALSLVLEWAALHVDELMADWHAAREGRRLSRIPPLG